MKRLSCLFLLCYLIAELCLGGSQSAGRFKRCKNDHVYMNIKKQQGCLPYIKYVVIQGSNGEIW